MIAGEGLTNSITWGSVMSNLWSVDYWQIVDHHRTPSELIPYTQYLPAVIRLLL